MQKIKSTQILYLKKNIFNEKEVIQLHCNIYSTCAKRCKEFTEYNHVGPAVLGLMYLLVKGFYFWLSQMF